MPVASQNGIPNHLLPQTHWGLRGPAPLNPSLHPGGWQGPGLLHIQQVARLTLQGCTCPTYPEPSAHKVSTLRHHPCPPSPWHHTGTGGSSELLGALQRQASHITGSPFSLLEGRGPSQPSKAQFCPLFLLFLGARSVWQGPLAWATCKPSLYLFCWSLKADRVASS